ncbi:MAG: capsular polysaccharide biosynthesis protein [Pseudomonadota bacterium]
MTAQSVISEAAEPRRLGVVSLGLLFNRHLKCMLRAYGWRLERAGPGSDAIAVWGASATAWRGKALAKRLGKPLVYLEDAPLRSVHPEDPLSFGFVLDSKGLPFGHGSSELMDVLAQAAPAHSDAANLMALLRAYRLSKYNAWRDAEEADLPRRFVLLCDQRRGDASIAASGGGPQSFERMLQSALDDHPGLPIVIRCHPRGRGHFEGRVLLDRVQRLTTPANPWDVLERAEAVYAVSSQLGQEAIFAGHRPKLFARPHYAGRGLDAGEVSGPALTAEQLFSVTHIDRTRWFDPIERQACDLTRVIERLDAAARHARTTARPLGLCEVRLWKRARVKALLGATGATVRFSKTPAAARTAGMQPVVWASRLGADTNVWQLEDGVLRSAGLGAELVPPLSLTLDRRGISFDATRPSDLEARCAASVALPPAALARAERLRARILELDVTKYGVSGAGTAPDGDGWTLVVGQVEDDASLLCGGGTVQSNAALLEAARERFPHAQLLYRAHPDVVAGLRPGVLPRGALAAVSAAETPASLTALRPKLERVVTMTSTLGFEALLRSIPVTCFGWPFYAGWGLTDDLGPPLPENRRGVPLSLDQLIHATLIESALYFDPVTRRACGPETVIERIAAQRGTRPGTVLRLLSKAQGALASTPFWR